MSRTTWKLGYFNGFPIAIPITLTIDTIDPFIVAAIERAAVDYGFELDLVEVREETHRDPDTWAEQGAP